MTALLGNKVELNLAGTWTDVTSYVRGGDGITITRGGQDEDTGMRPSTMALTLENDGRFSPRNPSGAYYGSIGRNTQIRASLPYGSSYLYVGGVMATDRATAPDSAALSITGDIDVRIDLETHFAEDMTLCGKYNTTGDQRSWRITMDSHGLIRWIWSTGGATTTTVKSTAAVPVTSGRLALRVTHDVNNGASGNTVTFYTSSSISGSWTQLGDPVVTSGTTSIFDSTALLEVGNVSSVGFAATPRRVLGFQLLNGIAGSVVANPDFSVQSAGATSFADTAAAPNTWTIAGGAAVDDRDYRFTGEVSEWPARSDITGTDVTVTIEASGVWRRLTQGARPASSPAYRARTRMATAPVAYWPCEDGDGATQFGSGLSDGFPMVWSGTPSLAAFTGADASQDLPTVGTSAWVGPVGPYTAGNNMAVQMIMSVPAGGLGVAGAIFGVVTTGTTKYIEVTYTTGSSGSLAVTGYTSGGSPTFTASGLTGMDGSDWLLSLECTQSGANNTVLLQRTLLTNNSSADGITNTAATTVSAVRTFRVFQPATSNWGNLAIGHVSVHNEVPSITSATWRYAHAGETAGDRFTRLCDEESVPYQTIGTLSSGAALTSTPRFMGVQRAAAFTDLIGDIADCDGGLIYEPRNEAALGYRTAESLYNQSARCAFSYTGNELADTLAPTTDDQRTRNDVTKVRLTRNGTGSSARVVLATGALSVLDPPNGVGLYATSETVNCYSDSQLTDLASWAVHAGTVDEDRFPAISARLTGNQLTVNTTLATALKRFDLGDRATISGPPAWLAPDTITQLIRGYVESIDNMTHEIVLACSPESPWQVGVVGDTVYGHLDTAGAELTSDITSGATSISVTTTSGPVWTTAAGDFPFDVSVGGEQMTVTNITSSTSPQTFTVTRSVNAVVKAHLAGSDVRLTHPMILAL